jgi:N-glycosidase YbiA
MSEDDTILRFRDEYAFLSNFSPAPVYLNRMEYPTVEHAFQAAKTVDPVQRLKVQRAETPQEAKRLGRKVTLRPEWDQVKLRVMRALLEQKFAEPVHSLKILETWPRYLVESNEWGDAYWGFDLKRGGGDNHLGKLLMEVRESLWWKDGYL